MTESGYLESKALEVLKQAVPEREVVRVGRKAGYARARADIKGSKVAKYAYLTPSSGGALVLSVYPGDTLEQARRLYATPSVARRLIHLEGEGWTVRPNFHFGFMAKGLCWTTSRLSAAEYAAYWMDRIHQTGVIHRRDWEVELQRLIDDGIFDAGDLAKFAKHFGDTDRDLATPRPGLVVERSWSLSSSLDVPISDQVRESLLHVEALCGHGGTAEAGKTFDRKEGGLVLSGVREIADFEFKWPDGTVERFAVGWEAQANWQGRSLPIRHGVGKRAAYGRERVHTVTWVRSDPTVEGVEADDYARSSALVSVLRHPDKRLIRDPDEIPSGYEGIEVVDHQSEIEAPYSRDGLAVKLRADDLRGWALHALLRADAYGRL